MKKKIDLISFPNIIAAMCGVKWVEADKTKITLVYTDDTRESGRMERSQFLKAVEDNRPFDIVSCIQSQREENA